MKKLVVLIMVALLLLSAVAVFASDSPADVNVDVNTCEQTTVTASLTREVNTTLYLVVDTADDDEQYAVIPSDGSEVSLSVGPFTEDTTVYWHVFGGGERDWDLPLWNGYGDPDFGSNIVDYYVEQGNTYNWVIQGTDDPNPFVTWYEVEVNGCAPEKIGKATGGLNLIGPDQQISFNAFDNGDSSFDKGKVEYQNFEYAGGLHYTTDVLCASVNPETNDGRFMFQIPEGWPALSGLYVVSYVMDGGSPGTNGDVYGHTSTSDMDVAMTWCETGEGFSPQTFDVSGGNLVVHK